MGTAFFDKSKEIANDFLQSVVFLDDKAFQNDSSQHAFNAFEVSKAFANEKKVCGIYNPTTKSDIYNFTEVAKKSDVVILDWLIKIPEVETLDNNVDEDEEDPRGKYTIPIINELINRQGLKLILIYTGEDILDEITTEIYEKVKTILPNKGECEISSDSIKLLVRHKSNDIENDKQKFNSRTHLLDKIILYHDLPDFVLTEFTKMTEGLLSNFALSSLTTIRNNSHKILGLFSKELDAAYMGHKALLPVQNDSEDLLLRLFGDTIFDLLHYASISQNIQNELIDTWIDNNISDEQFTINSKNFQRTKVFLKQLIHSEQEDIKERFENVFDGSALSKKDCEKLYRESISTEFFLNTDHQNKKDEINSNFAKLTHHKSLFLPQNTAPKLTLGTVVKSSTNQTNYYVCIQQRCDSVRLKRDEERRFLFLPLAKVENDKFHIITPDGTKLKLDKKSYSIKTIKFKCNSDEGEIKGISKNGIYTFKEIYEQGDTFEWILDLKDLHSQRIVTNYVSLLSRIGLDESEWLRIAGTN